MNEERWFDWPLYIRSILLSELSQWWSESENKYINTDKLHCPLWRSLLRSSSAKPNRQLLKAELKRHTFGRKSQAVRYEIVPCKKWQRNLSKDNYKNIRCGIYKLY